MEPYRAGAIANYLIRAQSERLASRLGHLKLQKLVYISYGFGLAMLGRRLFHDRIEAWQYGPVIPSLYHEFKRFGPRSITSQSVYYDFARGEYVHPQIDRQDTEALGLMNTVWRRYGRMTSAQLVGLTHQPETPWNQTAMGDVIPDDRIREHFKHIADRTPPGIVPA